jgi:hypothetical protein
VTARRAHIRDGNVSVRFAALADGSSRNCNPSFVAEQPRFVARRGTWRTATVSRRACGTLSGGFP